LQPSFIPHYNGLSKANIKTLDEPLKVVIAGVINGLKIETGKIDRPLSFQAILSQLLQQSLLVPRSKTEIWRNNIAASKRGPDAIDLILTSDVS
jgi:hypothetical protein